MRTVLAIAVLAALAACGEVTETAGGNPGNGASAAGGNAAAPSPAAGTAATNASAPSPAAGAERPGAVAQVDPSFDCAAADSAVERMICADAELRALDRGLAIFYRSGLRGEYRARVAREQREWLRSERDACTTPRCLRDTMMQQMWSIAGLGDDLPTYRSEPVHGSLTIVPLGQDWYAFGVLALWIQGQAVHDAGAEGAFRLENGRGEVVASGHDPCRFTLTRLAGDRWRIEEHQPESGVACGGVNATVQGTYSRVRGSGS